MRTEDLTPFFTGDLADTASIAGANVGGVFESGYQAALNGFVDSVAPSFTAATADLASVVQGSALTIASIAYKVTSVQPDGTGITRLELEKA